MNFGDLVEYDLRSSHGGKVEAGYCCGFMRYSSDVALLATEETIGMPIHRSNCKKISSGHLVVAGKLRDRYCAKFPGTMR